MNKFGGEFWDERYSSIGFVYGTEPNIFFKDELNKLTPGNILLLGEGEGRNAVYAAVKGWNVDAVDFSIIAKEKALKLAEENSVSINYEIADLSKYKPKSNYYDAAAIIFLHLNPKIRSDVHSKVVDSLKPGGTLILEVYEKEQLGKDSGGPQNIDMLYSKEELKNDFRLMKINLLEKKRIHLDESHHHKGEAYVLRFVGEKDY
ncbi:MAG: class I SAM-dependent methyltransferase [Bacteroidetes bacterium]|nr:class I SAM-dependent methyltransferase [Bacteroidota bacterium]